MPTWLVVIVALMVGAAFGYILCAVLSADGERRKPINSICRPTEKMGDRLLKESDVLKIAFQIPYLVNSAFFDAVKALPSAECDEGRLYIKIYADDEPSVMAEKFYQICGETQNGEVAKWLKEYFQA